MANFFFFILLEMPKSLQVSGTGGEITTEEGKLETSVGEIIKRCLTGDSKLDVKHSGLLKIMKTNRCNTGWV